MHCKTVPTLCTKVTEQISFLISYNIFSLHSADKSDKEENGYFPPQNNLALLDFLKSLTL